MEMGDKMGREKSDYLIKSVGLALDILEQFGKETEKLDSAAIMSRLCLGNRSAGRLLATLEERRYITRVTNTGHYCLGEKILELRHTFIKHQDLRRIALPVIKRMAASCNETCFLAKPEQPFMVYQDVFESSQTVRVALQQGDRADYPGTAAGKAFLAFTGWAIREKLLAGTAADATALAMELDRISARGYALEFDQLNRDMGAIAAPVRDHRVEVVATIGITAPLTRFGDERLSGELIPLLLKASGDISWWLGHFLKNDEKSQTGQPSALRRTRNLKPAEYRTTSGHDERGIHSAAV